MELRQLEYLVAAAEEGSFTRAALRCHVVQSGLSTAVRSLERELGTHLFIRGSRRVLLTAAGEALLPEARRALAAVKSGMDAVESVKGLLKGTLRVGAARILPPPLDLAALIAHFHNLHPAIRLRLRQDSPQELFEQLSSGALDIVVAGSTPRRWPDVRTRVLHRSDLVLAAPPGHWTTLRQSVKVQDLAEENFVDLSRDWTTRQHVDAAFLRAGIERDVAFEVNDPACLLSLVHHGLGIAIVPEMLQRVKSKARFVPLNPPLPVWELVGAHLGDEPPSAAARAFLALIETARRSRPTATNASTGRR